MPLILDLINAEGQSSAQKSSVTFRNAGGTIGRADSATWMLTDRSRHISGVHAEISYEEGVYYLTDRSTNGIYDVAKNARLQKNEDYPITHGDRFRMGSFVFKARVLYRMRIILNIRSGVKEPSRFSVDSDDEAGYRSIKYAF